MHESSLDTWVRYAYKENTAGPAENDVEGDLLRYFIMPPLDWEPLYTEPPLRDSPPFGANSITIPPYSEDALLVVSS